MRDGDVIPIESRRPPPAAPPPERVRAPVMGGLVVLAAILGLGAIGAVGVLAERQAQHRVAGLPPSDRAAAFRRAHQEIFETCRLPQAAESPLREHCANEASFVLLFSECDATCAEAARALLPRATR
jgi:hypothetical protein